MKSKKPSSLILKASNQADCHYAFYNEANEMLFTTTAGWDFLKSSAVWEGHPKPIDESTFINRLKKRGVPIWVTKKYLHEFGKLSNRDLAEIKNKSNVRVEGHNFEEPWVYVD